MLEKKTFWLKKQQLLIDKILQKIYGRTFVV